MTADPDEPEDLGIFFPDLIEPEIDAGLPMAIDPNAATLDLNFMAGALPTGLTFTRASTATYFDLNGVLQTAAVNAARWDYDPATKLLRGLLIEESRTNLILYSADLTQATNWPIAASSLTITTSTTDLSPDGVAYMSRVAEAATNSAHYVQQGGKTTVAGAIYTASFFAKAGTSRYLQVTLDDGNNGAYCTFDLQAGFISQAPAVRGTGVSYGATITPAGNGIYRCSVSSSYPGTTTRFVFLMVPNGNPGYAPSYLGNTANYLSIWGVQLEADVWATSYIATTTGAITRSADNCTLATSTWFSATISSLDADFVTAQSTNPSATNARTLVSISDGSSNLIRLLSFATSANASLGAMIAGAATNSAPLGAPITNGLSKIAGAWDGANMYGSLNGSGPTTDAIGMPTGLNVLTIGATFTSATSRMNGWIRRVRYWPRVLAPAELVAITASATAPTLDLDFTVPGQMPGGLTFTRNSAATYVDATGTIQVVGNNTPRWDYDPVTLACKGLLIEEGRTNVNWPSIPTGLNGTGTVTQAATTAPDGTMTGVQITADATNGVHGMQSTNCPIRTGNTPYTFSVFAKVVAGSPTSKLYLSQRNLGDWPGGVVITGTFDLVAGTVSVTSGGFAMMQSFPNGWFRLSVASGISTVASPTGNNNWINVLNAAGVESYVGAGEAMYLWGMQYEAGTIVSAYIPTTIAAAARGNDFANGPVGTIAAWFNPLASTLLSEAILSGGVPTQQNIVSIDDATAANTMSHSRTVSSNNIFVSFTANSVSIPNVNIGAAIPGSITKIASAVTSGYQVAALNGAIITPVTTTTITNPLAPTIVHIGTWRGNNGMMFGHFRRLRYWPRALAQAELIDVTNATVDLDFTKDGTLPTGVSFARAGPATYIDSAGNMQLAAAGVPRWDYDPGTRTLNGLLIEGPRTNSVLNSDTATPGGVAVASTDVPRLKAAATVWKTTWPAGGANGPVYLGGFAITAGSSYVASCWVWIPSAYSVAVDGPLRIDIDGNYTSYFILAGHSDMTKRDQWQRITTVLTVNSPGSGAVNVLIRRDNPVLGGSICYSTCPQVEVGIVPTSYIPAGAAATARLGDDVATPTAGWYNAAAGSIAADGQVNLTLQLASANTTWPGILNFTANPTSTTDRWTVSGETRPATIGGTSVVGGTQNGPAVRPMPAGPFTFAMSNSAAQISACLNGRFVDFGPRAQALPAGITQLQIGKQDNPPMYANGWISRVRYWPRPFTPTELQTVTGGVVPACVVVMA